jgi:hypothetical protein
MQRGRYDREVFQDRVDQISTDKELFYFMRKQLSQRRGAVRRWSSAKCIQGIYFVKVNASLSTQIIRTGAFTNSLTSSVSGLAALQKFDTTSHIASQ